MKNSQKVFCTLLLLFLYFSSLLSYAQENIVGSISSESYEQQYADNQSLCNETGSESALSSLDINESCELKNKQDTINTNSTHSQIIRLAIPAAFITYGLISLESNSLKGLDQSTTGEIKEHNIRKMSYDNYLQFLPIASVYGLHLLGVKSKSSLRDLTIVTATSHLLMASSVKIVKSTTTRWRPDDSSNNSFPSGHTATAFVGSHILFREYYKTSPWIAVSGYAVSTTTGILRVINKRHWVSDVVAGAGFGILSVELSYLLLPVINNVLFPSQKQKNISFAPVFSDRNAGFGMVYVY